MKKIISILLIISLWACSPSIKQSVSFREPTVPSQEVQVLNQKPLVIEVSEPEKDPKGKFVTKVVIYSIIGLGLLTYNDYIK